MFESMGRSYYHLLKKFHVKVSIIRRLPDSLQCNRFERNLNYPHYFDNLYRQVYRINKNNYKQSQTIILKALKHIMLEVGNGCSNLVEYIDYFKHSIKNQRLLLSKGFHNPWLLLQILSSRSKFIHVWGKFIKMGHYLGTMMACFKIYSPKKNSKGKKYRLLRLKEESQNILRNNRISTYLDIYYLFILIFFLLIVRISFFPVEFVTFSLFSYFLLSFLVYSYIPQISLWKHQIN